MSDRANRILWVFVAVVLMAAGGVGLSFSLGAWGTSAAHADIITSTEVRWWREGSWMSFASAAFIGLVVFALGGVLVRSQLTRNEGRSRLDDFNLDRANSPDPTRRGRTIVRAASLSHALEGDLERIPGVERALVGLFGTPLDAEVRARLRVDDNVDFGRVAEQVRDCLARLHRTTQVSPSDVDLTVTLVKADSARVQ
ncbi:MAG: hypothetical protein M0Z95_18860 [Actinomycetota bacterium]|jgi:hypothetical protein|nr:hypothetical protein [Actinomycetota bacterium]